MALEVLLHQALRLEMLAQTRLDLALRQSAAAAAEQMARLVVAEAQAAVAAGLTPEQVDQEHLDKAMPVAQERMELTQTLVPVGALAQLVGARADLFSRFRLAALA